MILKYLNIKLCQKVHKNRLYNMCTIKSMLQKKTAPIFMIAQLRSKTDRTKKIKQEINK